MATNRKKKLKRRNIVVLQHITNKPKAGLHKHKKREASRKACRGRLRVEHG